MNLWNAAFEYGCWFALILALAYADAFVFAPFIMKLVGGE
jgi:hypothetical protein